MKTNLDFLDTGSLLYILVAVAIVAVVLWSFLHEAIKPLFAVFKKPPTQQRRAPSTRHKSNPISSWKAEQSPHFQMNERQLNSGIKTQ
ncbi:MAG: hypothetical protein FGM16_10370 [Flavobacterium sp.]|nr:hypothetical protein [Flavobacterium sp.]